MKPMKSSLFLIALRNSLKLDENEFASKLGLSLQEYRNIESNPCGMRNNQFFKVFKGLSTMIGENSTNKLATDFQKAIQFDILVKHGYIASKNITPKLRLIINDAKTSINSTLRRVHDN